MYTSFAPMIGWAVLVIVLVLACWKGGSAERLGVVIVLAGAAYALLVHVTAPKSATALLLLLARASWEAASCISPCVT